MAENRRQRLRTNEKEIVGDRLMAEKGATGRSSGEGIREDTESLYIVRRTFLFFFSPGLSQRNREFTGIYVRYMNGKSLGERKI